MKHDDEHTHSRKDFLRTLGLGALGLGAAAIGCNADSGSVDAPAIQTGKTYRWNMVTTWPPNFPILGTGCNHFAEWVSEMSGGQLQIRVYGSGELIPALEAFDAVSSRTAEIGSGAAYYWAGKSPATQFFGAIPFGLNAQQVNTWLYSGGGMALWEEVYSQFNVIPLVGGNTGVQMG
ncbi:MAG: ABC transporter substrate-binding protein, partial [Saprospiraceae bacterium]|nr:ABC transporter substrate-binding protein [Saprospiraceae bacterium]